MNNKLRETLLLRYFSSIEYMEEMVDAHKKAIAYAKKAVNAFNKNPHPNCKKWPIWDSPTIWSIRVIPNFEATQYSMEKALDDARSGNLKRMRYLSESMRGISKDMDGIGWEWWSNIDQLISESFGYNFQSAKKHAENIYITLTDRWDEVDIKNERITGKIDEKAIMKYLKPGESIN